MNKSIWILIIIAIFFGSVFWVVSKKQIEKMGSDITVYVKQIIYKTTIIEINGVKIDAEVAKSEKDKIKGLSGRADLSENKGMLFVFGEPGIYEMTMRGMKFPLDAIWILNDKVVDLTENIKPPELLDKPIIFKPKFDANYVIEVNQGFISKNGIRVGLPVKIDLTKIK